MSGFSLLFQKLDTFAVMIYSILFRPDVFASQHTITAKYDSTFWKAAKFYLKIFSGAAAVWVYLLYMLGGQTIASSLFGMHPDAEKIFYIGLAVASTIVPAVILFLALRVVHGRALTLAMFLQVFFYAAGAVVVVAAVIAVVTAGLVLLFPISPDQAMSGKLTLLEAAGYPALCDKVQSLECQLSLRFGANLYYSLSFLLFGALLYQSILMAVMVNTIVKDRRRYPIYITAVALAGVVSGLVFLMELLAYASHWVPLGSGISQIVTYSRCANLLQRGDPEGAKPYCTRAVAERPNYEAAHANLCVALGQLEDFDGALSACNEAVDKKKDLAVTRLVRGATYSGRKQFGKAIEDFDAGHKILKGGGALLFFMRGEAYSELRRYQEALKDFTDAERKGMKNAKLYVARARAHIRLSSVAEAEKDLARAEVLDPRNAEVYITKSVILGIGNNANGALVSLNRAIELDRKNDAAYRRRCRHFTSFPTFQDALKDCNQAVKLKPGEIYNYAVRAHLHSRMGNEKLARANYGAALSILKMNVEEDELKGGDDHLVRAKNLGELAFAGVLAGDYEVALMAAKEALKLAKNEIWIEMNKAHALVFQGPGWEDEAKAIYVGGRGKTWGGRKWEDMLAEDFKQLRTAIRSWDDRVLGRIGNVFDEVERELGIEATKGAPPGIDQQ